MYSLYGPETVPDLNEDLTHQIRRYSNEQLLILAVLSDPQMRNRIDDELDYRAESMNPDDLVRHAGLKAA